MVPPYFWRHPYISGVIILFFGGGGHMVLTVSHRFVWCCHVCLFSVCLKSREIMSNHSQMFCTYLPTFSMEFLQLLLQGCNQGAHQRESAYVAFWRKPEVVHHFHSKHQHQHGRTRLAWQKWQSWKSIYPCIYCIIMEKLYIDTSIRFWL